MSNTSKPGNGNESVNHCGDELKENSKKLGQTIDKVLGIPINPAPVVDTARINELEAEKARLYEEARAKGVELSALNIKYDNVEQEAILLAFDRDHFTGERDGYVDQLSALGVSNRDVQAEFLRVSGANTALQARVDAIFNGYIILSERYSQTEAALDASKTEGKTLGTANKELEKMLKAASGIISAGEETVETLEASQKQSCAEIAELRETVEQDTEAIAAASAAHNSDRAAYKKQIKSRDEFIARLRDKKVSANAYLRRNLDTASANIAKLKEEIAFYVQYAEGLDADNAAAKAKAVADLNRHLSDIEKYVELEIAYEKQAEELGAAIKVADRVPGLESDKNSLEKKLKEESEAHQNVVKAKDASLNELSEKEKQYLKTIANRDKLVTDLSTNNDQLVDRARTAEADLEAKANELAAFKDAASWEFWAGQGLQCAIAGDLPGTQNNYAMAITVSGLKDSRPYLNCADACIGFFKTGAAAHAIETLDNALINCRLSRKEKQRVLDLRAKAHKLNGQDREARKDWKKSLGIPVISRVLDAALGAGINRYSVKQNMAHLLR